MSPERESWTLFEPLHAVVYFTPEGLAALEGAGLRGFWRGYFAARAAPLDRAAPAVVTALFAGFAPAMVERAVPSVWELATPAQALDARLAGSGRSLAGLLAGLEPAVAEAATLLRAVVEAAPTVGLALGAANAALPWPDDAHQALWQAATTIRELRGDGHVLAQVSCGLDGLATMVLRTGIDLPRASLQPFRGWTDEEWAAAGGRLVDRGLLDDEGRATPAGRSLIDRVEALTDELAGEPWRRAGADVADRFRRVAEPLVARVLPALPEVTPIGLPRR